MLNTDRNFRIYYDLLGPRDGEVVCMTHSMTSDSGMWAEQVPALLQHGYQVLRIDMRGHGGSDGVDTPTTLVDLADDLLAVLDRLEFRRVHYVGLSIGGMIGLKLAIDHASRFHSMLLADTAYKTVGDRAVTADRMGRVREAGNLASLVDGNMDRRFGPQFARQQPVLWAALRDTLLATKIAGYLSCTGAMQDFDFERQLPTLELPVMVVCGGDDLSTTPESNQRLANLIPGARYEEIKGGRHFPNVEFPDRFNSILLEWLGRNRLKSQRALIRL